VLELLPEDVPLVELLPVEVVLAVLFEDAVELIKVLAVVGGVIGMVIVIGLESPEMLTAVCEAPF
jgi:hypothetical protein